MRRALNTLLFLLFATQAMAQGNWEWTTRQSYHDAICRVRSQRGAGGSGALVSIGNGAVGVLSAKHVTDTQIATCTFQDGSSFRGRVFVSSLHDVSFVNIIPPASFLKKVKPLSFAGVAPRKGDYVEHCGYGGPTNKLRHWRATHLGIHLALRHQTTNGRLMHGDSGGPLLNRAHQVVGVNSTGTRGRTIRSNTRRIVFARANSPRWSAVRSFLQHVCKRRGFT